MFTIVIRQWWCRVLCAVLRISAVFVIVVSVFVFAFLALFPGPGIFLFLFLFFLWLFFLVINESLQVLVAVFLGVIHFLATSISIISDLTFVINVFVFDLFFLLVLAPLGLDGVR
jgi:hypothetical protein